LGPRDAGCEQTRCCHKAHEPSVVHVHSPRVSRAQSP
jgi:hypothetical protein